ncbi:peptidoglycan recognition protein [Streptomyces sp. NPDC004542]|uniref:peptidoglycan recognition protein family protein n=1 Tax=Streptomyces sp. NPDC004542 TaxID=3154281 RepID=UPI00339EC15B
MRGFLTSSIGISSIGVSSVGVTCAAALALPLTVPAAAAPARPADGRAVESAVPGATQSLPLVPLARGRARAAAPEPGLHRDHVRHFSLLGVVWDDPGTELRGRVQVRTRAAGTGRWSGWQDLETHTADHGADPGAAERAPGRVRGATAPLWVGDSDGVDVRVRADDRDGGEGHRGGGRAGGAGGRGPAGGTGAPLPSGLRLELVDPGDAPPPGDEPPPADAGPGDEPPPAGPQADLPGTVTLSEAEAAASAVNTDLGPFAATEIPALGRADTEMQLLALRGDQLTDAQRGKPHIGPRPRIVTRLGWHADESLREKGFVYTKKIKAAFVHHTASGNNYRCSQAPSVIRGIYRYHVRSMGWRDIGYNFLVDKCGTLYEGRAGGVSKAVRGAHTLGFNTDSMGVAVIGSYGSSKPSSAAVKAVAQLAAWKLGLYGGDPRGKTYLKSGGGNLYPKGKNVRLNVISGHRDGYATDCPGKRLYAKLGSVRSTAARYQGR